MRTRPQPAIPANCNGQLACNHSGASARIPVLEEEAAPQVVLLHEEVDLAATTPSVGVLPLAFLLGNAHGGDLFEYFE